MEKRRDFIRKISTGVTAVTFGSITSGMSANSYARIIGANERISIALIGTGRRHRGYLEAIWNKGNNVELVYLCDVMKSQREKAMASFSAGMINKPVLENDFRKVLADPKVDAVMIATPDHWHTPATCLAVAAGKHVYVEKPCSHNPHEAELIVAAQKKYDRFVQMGNQYRTAPHFREIIREIHNGIIGNAYKAICFYSNSRTEVDRAKKVPVPEGLDWNLYQGPVPRADYIHNIWDYLWHWYGWDFGTGETGNNAIHELDVARWALKTELPEKVDVEAAKRHFIDDGWVMYDTMDVTYKFPGNKVIKWDGQSRNGYQTYGSDRGTIIYGTEGSVFVDPKGYKLFDRNGQMTKNQDKTFEKDDGATMHLGNFLNTIRGKEKLNSPIEIGAISNILSNYANIAYRIGDSIKINPESGRINNPEAMKLWKREYEPGWEPNI